ncbi:hypothetical protein [Thiomicrorhabdus sp. Kp2]|uniref:hypothetical protein n=1 Tax=Thiomicrorhabdus sp. Kp2 TaxID=1123518 RepID=UPI00042091B3|nr:hypothetical protein [Thiomicrorhabdus sp. Kp2]
MFKLKQLTGIHTDSAPTSHRFHFVLIGLSSLVFIVFMLTLSANAFAETAENTTNKPLKEIEFLGLKLVDANLNKVRTHLWDIGGFLQAKSTIKQRNIDKFYPWSTIRDSYHVTFQYNNAGNVVTVKRVYRPYSVLNQNKRTPIETKDIAMLLAQEIGQPKFIKRKGWGGGLSYSSYLWEDDNIEVKIDREGSEKLGNVFIEYTIKNNKRYEVKKDVNNAV